MHQLLIKFGVLIVKFYNIDIIKMIYCKHITYNNNLNKFIKIIKIIIYKNNIY